MAEVRRRARSGVGQRDEGETSGTDGTPEVVRPGRTEKGRREEGKIKNQHSFNKYVYQSSRALKIPDLFVTEGRGRNEGASGDTGTS